MFCPVSSRSGLVTHSNSNSTIGMADTMKAKGPYAPLLTTFVRHGVEIGFWRQFGIERSVEDSHLRHARQRCLPASIAFKAGGLCNRATSHNRAIAIFTLRTPSSKIANLRLLEPAFTAKMLMFVLSSQEPVFIMRPAAILRLITTTVQAGARLDIPKSAFACPSPAAIKSISVLDRIFM